jgi:hypothetical protein
MTDHFQLTTIIATAIKECGVEALNQQGVDRTGSQQYGRGALHSQSRSRSDNGRRFRDFSEAGGG